MAIGSTPSSKQPQIVLRPFTLADVAEHNAGEDSESVRWLTEGHHSTVESTSRWIAGHAAAHRDGVGEVVFAVEYQGKLAGMVAANGDWAALGLAEGQVNISYAIYPWARRRGVATAAIAQMCSYLVERSWGSQAVIRVDPDNVASLRTAVRAGFRSIGPAHTPDGAVMEFLTWRLGDRS